ncbi:diaminopimelate epimerase [soil metagenome]
MLIDFFKYQGTGNDFIILDNRTGAFNELTEEQINFMCNRKKGIGADGLMMLNTSIEFDFEMIYFNADGKAGSMCGNGGRCMIRFVDSLGIHKHIYRFYAADGEHLAEIADNIIRLKMNDVNAIEQHTRYSFVNTGSPHYVRFVDDVKSYDVVQNGREIRNSSKFKEEGVNVNFVQHVDEDTIYVRTYERGVEDETLSCGTGVTAAALVAAHNETGFNLVEVKTSGGNLSVEFDKMSEERFQNIWLCGPAVFVFKGSIEV